MPQAQRMQKAFARRMSFVRGRMASLEAPSISPHLPGQHVGSFSGGRGQPDVVIECLVDLGELIEVPRDEYDIQDLLAMGYDSAKVFGFDVFAVYDPERVQILQFHDLNSFSDHDHSDESGSSGEYSERPYVSHPGSGYGSEDDYHDDYGSDYSD